MSPGTGGLRPNSAGALRLRCGPAGWSYRDWQGVVYPAPRPRNFRPVPFLAGLFDTIEVNVTFYRDISAQQLEAWCRQVADFPGFRWCFKLHQRFSHQGLVPTPSALLPALAHYDTVRQLNRLGALLLQFPWSLRASVANQERIVALVAAAQQEGWPLVVEVRHHSWAGASEAFSPVICDQPLLRGNLTCDEALERAVRSAAAAAGPLYIRLHGRNGPAWFARDAGRDERYNYLYSEPERRDWLERLQGLSEQVPDATSLYLIANNHFRGQAIVDALLLQQLWSGRLPALPAILKQVYRRELAAFPRAAPSTEASSDTESGPPTLF